MTNLEFQEILDKLEQGMTPELTKVVDGQTYTRVFLPENRLILLGGRSHCGAAVRHGFHAGFCGNCFG